MIQTPKSLKASLRRLYGRNWHLTNLFLIAGFLFYSSSALVAQEREGKKLNPKTTDSLSLEQRVQELDELVVTATRTQKTLSNTPLHTRLISSLQVKQNSFDNLTEALSFSVPGVRFYYDGRGRNIDLQGLGNNYNLILIDGEKMNFSPGGNVDFERLNLSNIQQIEIVKGAGSVLYGSNAIGSVINIITSKPDHFPSGWARVKLGRFQDRVYDAGFSWFKGGFHSSTSFYHHGTDGYNLNPKNEQNYTQNPFQSSLIEQRMGFQKGASKLSAKLRLYQGEEFNPPKSIKQQHYRTKNLGTTLKWEQDWAVAHRFSLVYHGDFDRRETVKEEQNDHFTNAKASIQTIRAMEVYERNGFRPLSLLTGLEYNQMDYFSTMQFGSDEQNRKLWDMNGFTQLDWQILEPLNMIVGLRYTHHSAYGDALTPKVNFLFSHKAWRLRTGYSQGFKAPNATELFSDFQMGKVSHNIGNPDLKPEHSHYVYLSAEYRQTGFDLSAEIFSNQVKNKIHSSFVLVETASGASKTELHYNNVDHVRVRGLELTADLRPLRSLSAHLAYSYSDARDVNSGLQLKGNAKHAATAVFTWKQDLFKKPGSLSLAGRWTSPRINDKESISIDPISGQEKKVIEENRMQAFSIWRLTAQYTPWRHKRLSCTASVSIDNLYNFTDPVQYASFDPGRRCMVALSFRF